MPPAPKIPALEKENIRQYIVERRNLSSIALIYNVDERTVSRFIDKHLPEVKRVVSDEKLAREVRKAQTGRVRRLTHCSDQI